MGGYDWSCAALRSSAQYGAAGCYHVARHVGGGRGRRSRSTARLVALVAMAKLGHVTGWLNPAQARVPTRSHPQHGK